MNCLTDSRLPMTIDESGLEVLPTPSRIDLKSIDDIRLEMARVYREMRSGGIEKTDGTKLVYVLAQMGKMIETHEIEKRMEALEGVLNQRKKLK